MKKDGGYYHFGEKTKTETKTTNSAGQITTTSVYYYREALVTSYDKDGKVQWTKKLPKIQEKLANLGYYMLSYTYTVDSKDNVWVSYTNLNKSSANMIGKWKDNEALLYKITPAGDAKSEVMFNSDNDSVTLQAKRSYEMDNGDLIIFGVETGNKYRFGKITFD